MNKIVTIFIFVSLLSSFSAAQEMDFYWANQYGSADFANNIKSITTDNENKIFAFTDFEGEFDVEGTVFTSEEDSDLLLYAINEDGDYDWALSDGGPGDQIAQQVHCDSEGNIYIMGKFNATMELSGLTFESNGAFDMFLAKYNTNGELSWVKTFGGPNSESIETFIIKHNHIYLGGRFYHYTILQNDTIYSIDGTDIFVAQLNLDGEIVNTMRAGGESVDMISSIDVDIYGNVYIVGDFYQDIQFENVSFDAGEMLGLYLVKLNANLDLIWAYQFIGDDLKPGLLVSVDNTGNATVAGTFSANLDFGNIQLNTADFDEDIFVANFNSEGLINWAHRYYSNSMESVSGLQVDRFGNTYLTGHYLNHIQFDDLVLQYNLCCGDPEIFLVKINDLGEIVNANQLTGERSQVAAMSVPELNQVILAGQFSEEFNIGEIVLHSPTSYNAYITYYKDDTWLYAHQKETEKNLKIFPNPFSNSFQISKIKEKTKILVYNNMGSVIQTIYSHELGENIGCDWPSGIYMIHCLHENGLITSEKVLKI